MLELGSGLGLCGMVAAHYASTTVLSDFDPWLVSQISQNLSFNRRSLGNSHGKAVVLDWDRLDESDILPVDIIVGSEIVHEPNMGIGVFGAIMRFLKKGGSAFLMLASSQNRFGMEIFLEYLGNSRELVVKSEKIPRQFQADKLTGLVQEDMNEIWFHNIHRLP